MVGRWDISYHSLTSDIRRAHLTDQTYNSVDGGSWKYVPNIEDFSHVTVAKFKGDLSPSGTFCMEKRAPTKVEIKIMSCWETQPGSANRWNVLFKTILRRPAEQVPVFANFLYLRGINLEKAPDKDIFVLFEKNLEVLMPSAIMGRASLTKAEHHHPGNISL
jgi:hypothetical protein